MAAAISSAVGSIRLRDTPPQHRWQTGDRVLATVDPVGGPAAQISAATLFTATVKPRDPRVEPLILCDLERVVGGFDIRPGAPPVQSRGCAASDFSQRPSSFSFCQRTRSQTASLSPQDRG